MALGAVLPAVVSFAGGLPEQIRSRGVGPVAKEIDGQAVADCVRALALDCGLYYKLAAQISFSPIFSMMLFLCDLLTSMPSMTGAR